MGTDQREVTTDEAVAREVMRRYFSGVNTCDWDDFRKLWHEDAEVEVVGGMHFKSVDEILAYFPRVLANFPEHYDDPYAIHVSGDIVTVEITFIGETIEGVPATWEAVDVFTLEDGRIRRLTTWYDMGVVVALLRTPGTPAKRLATQVRHAAENSPFYRRRFAELGLDPEQVAGDLTLLPPTRRDGDFLAAPAEFVAAAGSKVQEIAVVAGLGGDDASSTATTGYAVPHTRDDLEVLARLWARALSVAGVTASDVVQALALPPGLAEAARRARARLVTSAPAGLDAGRAVQAAAAAGTTVLVGPSGLIAAFRARAVELGVALPSVRSIALDGEIYGLPETGVVAVACAAGRGLHALTDEHLIEIVDPETGAPVAAGESGELLVTPLGRRGVTLLRLATGVTASWLADPCACGCELPLLSLAGRQPGVAGDHP